MRSRPQDESWQIYGNEKEETFFPSHLSVPTSNQSSLWDSTKASLHPRGNTGGCVLSLRPKRTQTTHEQENQDANPFLRSIPPCSRRPAQNNGSQRTSPIVQQREHKPLINEKALPLAPQNNSPKRSHSQNKPRNTSSKEEKATRCINCQPKSSRYFLTLTNHLNTMINRTNNLSLLDTLLCDTCTYKSTHEPRKNQELILHTRELTITPTICNRTQDTKPTEINLSLTFEHKNPPKQSPNHPQTPDHKPLFMIHRLLTFLLEQTRTPKTQNHHTRMLPTLLTTITLLPVQPLQGRVIPLETGTRSPQTHTLPHPN